MRFWNSLVMYAERLESKIILKFFLGSKKTKGAKQDIQKLGLVMVTDTRERVNLT